MFNTSDGLFLFVLPHFSPYEGRRAQQWRLLTRRIAGFTGLSEENVLRNKFILNMEIDLNCL